MPSKRKFHDPFTTGLNYMIKIRFDGVVERPVVSPQLNYERTSFRLRVPEVLGLLKVMSTPDLCLYLELDCVPNSTKRI